MASKIDQSNALNVTARDADGWWLDLSCSCGKTVYMPLRLLVERQPHLADARLGAIARQLRCTKCGSKPPTNVGLTDNPARASQPGHPALPYSGSQATSISLMGAFDVKGEGQG